MPRSGCRWADLGGDKFVGEYGLVNLVCWFIWRRISKFILNFQNFRLLQHLGFYFLLV